MARIRLDKVVDFRERAEDAALLELAEAHRRLLIAEERLEEARARARADQREAGDASLWLIEDVAHRRALQVVRTAAGDVDVASKKQADASANFLGAHQDAEAVRRVADRKRAELAQEAARQERRAADEVATLRFNRK